jgi:hypothetical protein
MKKSGLLVALALSCLPGLGKSAHAQDASGVVMKVPFEFVVGHATLRAGTYSISRVSSKAQAALVVRGHDSSSFVLPFDFDGTRGEPAKVSFEHVGDKYFLSRVETPAGVYTIRTPGAMAKLAQMKDHDTVSSSGAN